MSYSQENGYLPVSIETIMTAIMANINTQFQLSPPYTMDTFIGTNAYKYFYALAQRMQENEIKTSEIFLKLQQYISITNERISRPVNTPPGIVEKMKAEGYVASVKPMIDADAGKISIAVDVDETDPDYAATKLAINTLISQITVAGVVTQGDQTNSIVLSNGQSFTFKYFLPDRIPVLLRLTITLSENNQLTVGNPDETKLKLLSNILSRYSLGKNFEPQRYFSVVDAPWASVIKLEWSDDDGANYYTTVFDAEFDELFTFGLEDIELVEN